MKTLLKELIGITLLYSVLFFFCLLLLVFAISLEL